MSDMSRALGGKIRAARLAAGYASMEAFAHALGVSWPTISRYERGVATPTVERLHQIADLLNVPVEHFLEGVEAA